LGLVAISHSSLLICSFSAGGTALRIVPLWQGFGVQKLLRRSHARWLSFIFLVGEMDAAALNNGPGTGTGVSVPLLEKIEILRRARQDASCLRSTAGVILAASSKEVYSIFGMTGGWCWWSRMS
jgi:hypothetical protein